MQQVFLMKDCVPAHLAYLRYVLTVGIFSEFRLLWQNNNTPRDCVWGIFVGELDGALLLPGSPDRGSEVVIIVSIRPGALPRLVAAVVGLHPGGSRTLEEKAEHLEVFLEHHIDNLEGDGHAVGQVYDLNRFADRVAEGDEWGHEAPCTILREQQEALDAGTPAGRLHFLQGDLVMSTYDDLTQQIFNGFRIQAHSPFLAHARQAEALGGDAWAALDLYDMAFVDPLMHSVMPLLSIMKERHSFGHASMVELWSWWGSLLETWLDPERGPRGPGQAWEGAPWVPPALPKGTPKSDKSQD